MVVKCPLCSRKPCSPPADPSKAPTISPGLLMPMARVRVPAPPVPGAEIEWKAPFFTTKPCSALLTKSPTIWPKLLMSFASVIREPGNLNLKNLPPEIRNPWPPALSVKVPTMAPLSFTPPAPLKMAPGMVRVVNLHCAVAATEKQIKPHNKLNVCQYRRTVLMELPQKRQLLAARFEHERVTIRVRGDGLNSDNWD